METLRLALLGGGAAAAATTLGTLPVLFARTLPARVQDACLGFGAGVMLAASAFSLVLPALEAAGGEARPWRAAGVVAAAVMLGALVMLLMERWLPHEHFVKGREGPQARRLKKAWLFVAAIALHNLPEGFAIGAAYAGGGAAAGHALATGIAVQDIPEGLVVALALRAAACSRLQSVSVGVGSGLLEPVGAVLAALLATASPMLLPWSLASAAGAMLFVISHEVIPESHRQGHERLATSGLIVGFVLMMSLDTALG